MARTIGGLVNLGIAKELARGTMPDTADVWYPWIDVSFKPMREYIYSQEALGNIDETHESKVIAAYGEGDFSGEVRVNPIGYLLYGLMGTLSTAVVEAGTVWDHTFTLANNNQHQSLTFYFDEPNGDYRFPLVMIETFELQCELSEYVKFNGSFVSNKEQDSVIASPTHIDDYKFVSTQANIKFAVNIAGLAAASVTKMQSMTLTVAKNLLRKMVLGTIDPYDILNQVFGVTGSFTLPYEDKTFRDYFKDGTSMAMEIELLDNSTLIGAVSHPTLTIQMPSVTFEDFTPQRPKGELYEQEISFKAKRDEDNDLSSISSIVLRNTTDTY